MKPAHWFVVLVLGVSCAPLERPQPSSGPEVRGLLSTSLRSGAAFLCPRFDGLDPYGTAVDPSIQLSTLDRADGSSLLVATDVTNTSQASPLCAGVVASDGTVRELEVPKDFEPIKHVIRTMAVDTPQGALLGWCMGESYNVTVSALWWQAGTGAFVPVTTPLPCASTLLPAADGQGWYDLSIVADVPPGTIPEPGTGVVVQAQRYSLGSAPKPVGAALRLATATASPGDLLWGQELSANVFAWVVAGAGSVGYYRSDTDTVATLPWTGTLQAVRRDPTTGLLWLTASDRLEVWDAEGDGSAQAIPLPSVPAESSPWAMQASGLALSTQSKPNPEADWLRIPVAASLASVEAASYVARDIPTTPCTTTEACRAVAEFYLVGATSVGGRPMGIYYAWPWDQQYIVSEMLVAPLDGPAP